MKFEGSNAALSNAWSAPRTASHLTSRGSLQGVQISVPHSPRRQVIFCITYAIATAEICSAPASFATLSKAAPTSLLSFLDYSLWIRVQPELGFDLIFWRHLLAGNLLCHWYSKELVTFLLSSLSSRVTSVSSISWSRIPIDRSSTLPTHQWTFLMFRLNQRLQKFNLSNMSKK